MKKILTPEFLGQMLIQVVFIGIILFFLHNYYQRKWTPLTAAETLKKENLLNSKRDIYFEAIDILNRNLANTDFTVHGRLSDTSNRRRGGAYPTELEVNSCFSKLCIYSDNEEIPLTFYKLFDTNDRNARPILQMSIFINLLRKDLGYGDAIIDTVQDRYKFIQIHRKDD